jgi:hypothetical protein
MDIRHIESAIREAKKAGFKRVQGFVGGFQENSRINKELNDGTLEIFTQINEDGCEIQLLRKPIK